MAKLSSVQEIMKHIREDHIKMLFEKSEAYRSQGVGGYSSFREGFMLGQMDAVSYFFKNIEEELKDVDD